MWTKIYGQRCHLVPIPLPSLPKIKYNRHFYDRHDKKHLNLRFIIKRLW